MDSNIRSKRIYGSAGFFELLVYSRRVAEVDALAELLSETGGNSDSDICTEGGALVDGRILDRGP